MTKRVAMFASLGLALLLTLSLRAAEDKAAECKCPVSGKPCVEAASVDYKGGKVYFCCMNCPKAFANNPEKFAAKANHQLVATGQAVQVKCPLTGRAINETTGIEVAGAKVAFCRNNCKGKATKAEGAEQINLIFADPAFAKGFEVKKEEAK